MAVKSADQLRIGDRAAIQYEIRATVEGVNVKYLHTTIDGSDHFHQVLAWTLNPRFNKYRRRLASITASFEEVAP